MISFFANLFGYILNFFYEVIGNFGVAIILFSLLVKIILLPMSVKQQKTMKKSIKINEEMKQIQFKYKNDPEKMNQEVMSLYKRENMSPFSGCLSSILQLILLFSVFFLVRSPLTYMKKIDAEVINKFEEIVQEQGYVSNYKEISVINYINKLRSQESVSEEQNNEEVEQDNNEAEVNENEEELNKEETIEFNQNEYIEKAYVNMNFLGMDLSKVPTEDMSDYKVFIIPALYVISSFISIRLSTNMQGEKKKNKEKLIGDGTKQEEESYDPMQEANKSMSWFMPIMSISIACIAPLGLALYWLINNILMILERLILNKVIKDDNNKEEAIKNA